MEARDLRFVLSACQGELRAGSLETPVLRVSTDSRRVQPGDLFFALPGERFDGHQFLGEATSKGAAAVVAARNELPGELRNSAFIRVEDTRKALGKLAAAYRKDFALSVVAVAGSNGKTTTKEL